MKIQVLFTRVLEGEVTYQMIEDEINRLLSKVEGTIVSVQIDEIQYMKAQNPNQ